MKENVCKVMMRNEDGDEIIVTVTTGEGVPLDESAFKKLKRGVSQKIVPELESFIYFTVRVTVGGVKKNWKCKTIESLNTTIREVFGVEEAII